MTLSDVFGSTTPPTADELARAWDALRSGQFRDPAGPAGPAARPVRARQASPLLAVPGGAGTSEVACTPIPGPVVLVVGAHGWSGASTTALLLAEAAARGGVSARLVDVADPSTSGLVGAAVTEHGHDETGEWRRGSRTVLDAAGQTRQVWLERLAWPTLPVAAVPDAPPARADSDGERLTVVDAGRSLIDLLLMADDPSREHHWLVRLLRTAPVVVTARATVAGVQRAGTAVAALRDLRAAVTTLAEERAGTHVLEQPLTDGAPLVVALVGTSRLPRVLEDHLAATLPTVTVTPDDRRWVGRERLALLPTPNDLTVQGITSSELPRQLAPAATRLLHATGVHADLVPVEPGAAGRRPARRWRPQG